MVRPHAISACKTLRRSAIAVLLLAVLAAPGAAAQSGEQAAAAAAPPESAAGQAVKVFTVSPAMRYRAIMPPAAPGSERSLEPPALDPALVRAALGSFGGGMPATGDGVAVAERVLDQFSLTAQKMSFPKRGYLILDLAHQVDAQAGVQFRMNSPGSATVNLNIEKGRAYLLDFAVNSWGDGAYQIETEGGAQSFQDPRGEMQHLLVGIEAATTGLSTITLRRSGSGYYLHAVTVSWLE